FDDSAKSDKGWTQDYTLADLPNHGWVFNNTSVTAGGDVSLKGAGFTNSVVTITNGNLSIDNGGPAPLTGTTLTVDGGVNVHAGAGSIDLKNGNISAKGNITLKADAGSIAISGTNASVKANITSTEGGVNLVSMQAINITNANFLADKDISLNVASEVMGTLGIGNASFTSQSGDVDLFLDTKKITPIIITTDSQYGGLIFSGENSFEAKNINISALSSKDARGFSLLFESGAILNLKGETHINASNESDGTGRNDAALGSRYRRTQINVSDGDLYITASALSGTGIFGLVTAGQWADAGFEFVLNNSDLYIDANSKFGNGITLGCYGGSTYINGLTFKGNGNVSVHAQGGGYGITLSRLYTGELDGNVQLTGIGGNGAGIDASINTVFQGGVSLSGSSADDVGVSLSFGPGIQEHNMNLNGSNVTGSSENGSAGILIEGKNISFTNGTLTGTATSGNGSGVVLTGGSNYTLDGASVTGTAADGSGIAVNGTLTVNNGTVVKGLATGGGNGVTVSGDLVTDSGDGISITGTAFSGDGVKVDGDTTLTNAMLNGRADSGNGVNIAGNLTTDSSTQVSGHAASGTGVNLGAALTGASVKGSSDTGTGVQLADNAVVTEAVLNGSSTSGDGVTFTGNVKMDDTSAAKLNASSTSGTGLKLADNANVSIQTITKVTQEKKDADGNPVLDADGNPETETITTQAPVTTPVTLTGTSEQGSGIATEGNVSISGIVLNGSTTADTGTGVSLGGNLTIADDISGVTAGATGNGTALVVNNASIHSDGYTDSGKDFVINASVSGNGTAIKTQGSSQLDEVVLNGNATGGGTAVELGGQVSGANITGTSDSGTAVRVTDGAGVDGSAVKGHSDSGMGLQVSGNASLNNSDLSGTT
ncbi:hypothetical protein OZG01_005055, partial [Salmonella enterica]|nr:hypothetical protein [Salmonella enterica]